MRTPRDDADRARGVPLRERGLLIYKRKRIATVKQAMRHRP